MKDTCEEAAHRPLGQTLEPGPNPGLMGRAVNFHTCKRGVLRTAGVVLLRPEYGIDDLPLSEALALARVALTRKDAAASGKVALLGPREVAVLQATQHGDLTPAFCGNATAAAILASNKTSGEIEVVGPGGARITSAFRRDGCAISQSWLLPDMNVSDFAWRGRYCVRVRGLNSYYIITGGLPVGMQAETCRRQLAEGQPNAKLAVFGIDAPQNQVAFYNASGKHGAAPMTGLASLAIAAYALPRFAARINAPNITYQTALGLETHSLSPASRAEDGRFQLALPDVDAFLSPLSEVS